jgi:hypothetical protein
MNNLNPGATNVAGHNYSVEPKERKNLGHSIVSRNLDLAAGPFGRAAKDCVKRGLITI